MTMENPDLTRALRSRETGQRTRFCPEDAEIAAWFDLRLAQVVHDGISAHLAECSHCRSRVGMLARLEDGSSESPVSERLLVRAKQLAGPALGADAERDSTVRPRRIAAWAAAAAIVLALGLLLQAGPGPVPAPETRTLRSAEPAAARPRIVYPVQDSSVVGGSLEVRWTGVEGSAYYDLLLLDDTGAPLLSEQLTETRRRLNAAWSPRPGSRYYVRVTAHLADGRTASSEHVAFSVAEP